MTITAAVRLNLGCGDDRRAGYTNVDYRTDVADVEADAANLSRWADGSVDEILAADLLEHFPRVRIPDVLDEWARVLHSGGTLTVKVPNMEALAGALLSSSIPRSLVIENIYGGHRWGPDGMWDSHHWGWVPDDLDTDLTAAGFTVQSNDRAINMTVVAVKR